MDPSEQKRFPYPPIAILLLWPLGLLPYGAAYVAWVAVTLGLFLWAVAATCSRSPLCIVSVLVAPVTAATIVSGQSGFLAAALITGGIRLAPVGLSSVGFCSGFSPISHSLASWCQ